MVILDILLFILGVIFLVKGADLFVFSSARIAKKFGVSEFVIGLTFVAIGTSIPELASSIVASIKHNPELVVGNVIGSNVANIGLILGLSAAIAYKRSEKTILNRDSYIMLSSAIIFYLFALNEVISRIESGILLLFYASYLLFLFEVKPGSRIKNDFTDFVEYFFKFQYITTIRSQIFSRNKKTVKQEEKVKKLFKESIIMDLLFMLISGVGIVYGAKLLVDGAISITNYFSLPTAITGVLFVAIGTSIPELVVSLTAARKGHGSMAIGNILGSNIANIALIVGVSGLISPLTLGSTVIYFLAPFMIFISLLLVYFLRTKWKVSRTEGIILLILYVLFILAIFFGLFEHFI